MTQTFHHYLAVVEVRNTQTAVEADLVGWCQQPPFDWQVARLATRGITAGRADVGRRGRRLAPVRPRQPVHGVLRSGAKRILQRQPGPPWPADHGRQRAPAGPVGGVGLVLPAPALGRPGDRPPPARPRPGGHRPGVGGAAAPVHPVPHLAARKHADIVAAAIARELAGFLWAEMTAALTRPPTRSPLEIGREVR